MNEEFTHFVTIEFCYKMFKLDVTIIKKILPSLAADFYSTLGYRADDPVCQSKLRSAHWTNVSIFCHVILEAFEMKFMTTTCDCIIGVVFYSVKANRAHKICFIASWERR